MLNYLLTVSAAELCRISVLLWKWDMGQITLCDSRKHETHTLALAQIIPPLGKHTESEEELIKVSVSAADIHTDNTYT